MSALKHTVTRTARIPHQCASCDRYIRRGQRYLSHTHGPGGDMGFIGWNRIAECAACAERYGRPIEPVTAGSGAAS